MPLPRFDFAPHEWPPLALGEREGLADAVFRVVWDGEVVEVAARWVGVEQRCAYLFFRSRESGPLYVVSDLFWNGTRPFVRSCMEEQKKVKLAVTLVQKAIRGWGLSYGCGRCVAPHVWNTRHTQWLFVLHDGSCGMWNDWHPELWPSPFRVERPTDLAPDAMNNPDSPLRFALDWSQMSHEERLRYALRFGGGDLKEIQQVVKSIALCEPSLHRPGETGILYFDDELASSWRYSFGIGWEKRFPDARLRRWDFHIKRFFAPQKKETLAARHLCVERFHTWPIVRVDLHPPTQHERLEAALFLRDWARGKIPPDELRMLLPKL